MIPFIVLSITTIYSLQIVTESLSKDQLLRNHNIVLQVSIENKLQSTKRPLHINGKRGLNREKAAVNSKIDILSLFRLLYLMINSMPNYTKR